MMLVDRWVQLLGLALLWVMPVVMGGKLPLRPMLRLLLEPNNLQLVIGL